LDKFGLVSCFLIFPTDASEQSLSSQLYRFILDEYKPHKKGKKKLQDLLQIWQTGENFHTWTPEREAAKREQHSAVQAFEALRKCESTTTNGKRGLGLPGSFLTIS